MSNNSVSIRSPLSCVRGLQANRCPRLMLTSYSWLAAIKSINENINTNFSTSLSPYVRAAQRQGFPRGLCEWTGCSEPARSGSPGFVYWTACAETRRGTQGGRRTTCALPQPRALRCQGRLGERHGIAAHRGTDPPREERQPAPMLNAAPLYHRSLCSAVMSLCCAVTDSVIINNVGSDIHGAEEHLYLGVLHRLKTYYRTYLFIVPNTKLNCGKRHVFPGHTEKRGKKYIFLLHGTKGCKLRPKHQDTEVLQQSAILLNSVHTQNLHYYLTKGLFMCSVKMVLSWKQSLCHHLLLWVSAGDLRQRRSLQVFAGRPGMLACYPIC